MQFLLRKFHTKRGLLSMYMYLYIHTSIESMHVRKSGCSHICNIYSQMCPQVSGLFSRVFPRMYICASYPSSQDKQAGTLRCPCVDMWIHWVLKCNILHRTPQLSIFGYMQDLCLPLCLCALVTDSVDSMTQMLSNSLMRVYMDGFQQFWPAFLVFPKDR